MSLSVQVCTACDRACFPPRLLCPNCGGGIWNAKDVESGVVLEATTIAYRADSATDAPVHLASVRIAGDTIVVARLDDVALTRDAVRLWRDESGAVLASRKDVDCKRCDR